MSRPEDDVPTDADFGIHEGEVDELERRWATRAEEQEENNRLVSQEEFEIEVDGGPAAEAPMRWTGLRRRRRRVTALDRALFNACPVFYGWVVAVLVAASVKSMRARERELARLEAEAPRRRRRGNTPEAGSETGRENG